MNTYRPLFREIIGLKSGEWGHDGLPGEFINSSVKFDSQKENILESFFSKYF